MNFDSLELNTSILSALKSKGYTSATPIQAQAIPAILQGKDVMAAAQTGTGKTAGFTLPVLELLSRGERARPNQVRALILTPTRELAAQVADSVEQYSKDLPLRSTVVFGGVKINPQMMALRKGADILVATPGRLMDLYNQNAVKFSQLEILVLDEADRMLDMGFIRDIKKIMAILPNNRQNLLFSATFSDDIRGLAKQLVKNPIEISVSPRNTTTKLVEQYLHPVDKKQKSALLMSLIVDKQWKQVLVFMRTKHGANKLTRYLEGGGIKAAAIHGNKSQGARTKALANFKSGEVNVLVATDIAARGIDIDQLPQVVNFELPAVAEDYVHRIGRTGRAGASGEAVSLVCADEHKELCNIESLIQQEIKREYHAAFRPVNELPTSLPLRTRKAHKPKRPKPTGEHHNGQAPRNGARGGSGQRSAAGTATNNRRPRSSGANKSSGNNTGSSHAGNGNTNNTRPSRAASSGHRKPSESQAQPSSQPRRRQARRPGQVTTGPK